MNASKGSIALALVVVLGAAAAAQNRPDLRLVQAMERRDVHAVEGLLKQRIDVNAAQPDGATALHWAAHWDDVATAERLLRAGAKVNAANDLGVTPLALACENGSVPMVEALLRGAADPNSKLLSGEAAIMTAARTGNARVVQALVAGGANVNAKEESHGQTALMWAVANRHPEVVRVLLASGADVNARSEVRPRVVHTGNRFGDRNESRGVVTLDLGGFTPLLFAARQGDLESARLLLDAGAKVEDRAATAASALVVAAHSGQGAFAKMLLDKGADANAAGAGYTALHAAVLRGDLDLGEGAAGARREPEHAAREGDAVALLQQGLGAQRERPRRLDAALAGCALRRRAGHAGAGGGRRRSQGRVRRRQHDSDRLGCGQLRVWHRRSPRAVSRAGRRKAQIGQLTDLEVIGSRRAAIATLTVLRAARRRRFRHPAPGPATSPRAPRPSTTRSVPSTPATPADPVDPVDPVGASVSTTVGG